MIGCASHGDGRLTFFDNTCDVEGREEQHDPMIMQWQFTSEAAKSLVPLPAQTSKTNASGAQEHAIKEAAPKPLPIDISSASEHDSDSNADWGGDEETERVADEDQMAQESKDAIGSIGFALANSLAVLPEFILPKKCKNCIDIASADFMRQVCSQEEIQALTSCMESFFLKRQVRQSTASTTDDVPAQTLKSAEEIKAVWTEILARRRSEEEDDTVSINDRNRLKKMHADWLQYFIDNKLTAKQRSYKRSRQTSFFGAYLKNNFGGKAFVMALWQTGIPWVPTKETNYAGALEHIASNFGQWAQRIIRARKHHQENAETMEARRRSGGDTGKHGLIQEEMRNRDARKKARIDYYWTKNLDNQVRAFSGQAKGKSCPPKAYNEMSHIEQWWLRQLWSGRLQAELERANELCSRVQAPDFNVFDYD